MFNVSLEQLKQIIKEELEAANNGIPDKEINSENPGDNSEVEAEEGVWSGGDNLAVNLDHSKEAGGEEVTPEPETMPIVERLDNIIADLERSQKYSIPPQAATLFELYDLQNSFKTKK